MLVKIKNKHRVFSRKIDNIIEVMNNLESEIEFLQEEISRLRETRETILLRYKNPHKLGTSEFVTTYTCPTILIAILHMQIDNKEAFFKEKEMEIESYYQNQAANQNEKNKHDDLPF